MLNNLHMHVCSLGDETFSISLLILSNPELVLFFSAFMADCNSLIVISNSVMLVQV